MMHNLLSVLEVTRYISNALRNKYYFCGNEVI